MNNKGFTLIELLTTIAILAIIITIASPFVVTALNNSRQKSYDIMIENIKTSAKTYYEECKYNGASINCDIVDNKITVTLQKLVDYGFLEASSKTNCTGDNCSVANTIENPKDKEDIGACSIIIERTKSQAGRVEYNVKAGTNSNQSCPQGELGSVS